MMNLHFHKFPGEVHKLPCGWNFFATQCHVTRTCKRKRIKGGISALHGIANTFMEGSREPVFQSVFQVLAGTQLNATFKLQDVVRKLKLGLDIHMNTKNKSGCAGIRNFDKLVLRRLEKKQMEIRVKGG